MDNYKKELYRRCRGQSERADNLLSAQGESNTVAQFTPSRHPLSPIKWRGPQAGMHTLHWRNNSGQNNELIGKSRVYLRRQSQTNSCLLQSVGKTAR